MNLKKLFGDRGFWTTSIRLAIPIALQSLLTSSFHLVDTMMVSRLGDVTLSAVGMAGQWSWLFNLVLQGLCAGLSVFVAQYWGVWNMKGIRASVGLGFLTGLAASIGFQTVALLAPRWVVGLFNQDPQVLEIGVRYLKIICWTYPAVLLTNLLSTALRNTEQVQLPMFVSFFTTIANALLNYGLIFGKLGMPELGVEGAAIASCISAWAGPVLIVIFSIRARNALAGPVWELFAFDRKLVKEFYIKAFPVILNQTLWAIGILNINRIFGNMGYEYYAGITVYKTFGDMTYAFFGGMGNACVIMVGKSVGQGKIRRTVEDAIRFTILIPLSGLLIGGILILLRHPLVAIFAAGDNLSALTLQTAVGVTVVCGLEVAFRNIPYTQVVGVFRAGGDTLAPMFFDLGCLWLVALPSAWLCANVFHLPFLAVVAAAYLGEDLPKAICCLIHFRSKKWIKPVTPEGRAGLEEYLQRSN